MKFLLNFTLIIILISCSEQKSYDFKVPEDASYEQLDLALAKVAEEKPELKVKALHTDNYGESKEYLFVFEDVKIMNRTIEFSRSIWLNDDKITSGGGWSQNRIVQLGDARISIMKGSSFFNLEEKLIKEYCSEALKLCRFKPDTIAFSSHRVDKEVSIFLYNDKENSTVKLKIKDRHRDFFK